MKLKLPPTHHPPPMNGHARAYVCCCQIQESPALNHCVAAFLNLASNTCCLTQMLARSDAIPLQQQQRQQQQQQQHATLALLSNSLVDDLQVPPPHPTHPLVQPSTPPLPPNQQLLSSCASEMSHVTSRIQSSLAVEERARAHHAHAVDRLAELQVVT